MKHLITSILLLAATTLSAQNNTPTDWQLANLKGKVKTIRTIPYSVQIKEDKVVKAPIANGSEFDKMPNLNNYQKDFNPQGYLTQEILYQNDDKFYNRTEYYYTPNDKLFETRYNSDKTYYAYNPDGYLVKVATYSPGGFLKYHHTNEVNPEGKVLKREIYQSNQLINIITYTYNKKGNPTQIRTENSSGELVSTEETKYNKHQRPVRIKISDEKNKSPYVITQKYNAQGDCIWFQVAGKQLSTYQYIYDDQGNWISMTTFVDGKPEQIIERTLQYYE